jgi:hypothetical protein
MATIPGTIPPGETDLPILKARKKNTGKRTPKIRTGGLR